MLLTAPTDRLKSEPLRRCTILVETALSHASRPAIRCCSFWPQPDVHHRPLPSGRASLPSSLLFARSKTHSSCSKLTNRSLVVRREGPGPQATDLAPVEGLSRDCVMIVLLHERPFQCIQTWATMIATAEGVLLSLSCPYEPPQAIAGLQGVVLLFT